MYKHSRVAEGLIRLLKVAVFVLFLLGLLVIYADTAPQDSYTYTDYRTGIVSTYPSRPFQFDNFIIYTFVLALILWAAFMVAVYVINGFRSKEK